MSTLSSLAQLELEISFEMNNLVGIRSRSGLSFMIQSKEMRHTRTWSPCLGPLFRVIISHQIMEGACFVNFAAALFHIKYAHALFPDAA